MFDRLLKPKWRHPDPRKRQAALETGNVPLEALASLASDDRDPTVRCCAIKRVDDLNLLAKLLQAGPPSQVREALEQRLQALLVTPLTQASPLEQRLAAIHDIESPAVWGFTARHADALEIRCAALERVTDTQLLCAIAIEDPVASARRLALERIDDPAGWEIVSRKARNKDKQVSRAARERLETYQKEQAEREAAAVMCQEMEDLLAAKSLKADSQARYQRLCSQWDRLTASLPSELSGRIDQARQASATRLEQFEHQLTERRAICSELESLLKRLQEGQEAILNQPSTLEEQLLALDARWLATVPEPSNDDPLSQRFTGLQQLLHQGMHRLGRDRARVDKLRDLIGQAQAALDEPERLNEGRIKQLQQRWSERDKPETQRLAQTLQDEFEASLQQLKERLNQQIKQRKKALEEAEQMLPELAESLEQGELERALSLRDRITHRLKKSKGIADQRRSAVQQGLHGMHDRLEELRQWRHWGSGHAREQLCNEIEALIGSVLAADEIAAKVRTARKAWQRIDHAEGPAEEALWQRFDQACSRAYEPFQQERKQQEEILNQHLAQKRQLCDELDAFERDTDWEQVDWREVDQYVHKAREKWRRIGPVPRKAGKSLEKNYHAVLDRLEARLSPERERELRRRRMLIARVEELAKSADLRAASREAKAAQEQWKPTVPLPRKQEQALWQEFRKACDAVFNQLREERDAADAQRQANLERKQAICNELETLLDQPDRTFREIHKRFDEHNPEWAEIGEIPRKQQAAIEARYEQIQQRLAALQHQEKQAAEQAKLENIRAYAELCAQLERALLDSSMEPAAREGLLTQAEQAWQALPELDPEYVQSLQARYELAGRALRGDDSASQSLREALPDNLQQRLHLCLQVEVAAGVESPAEYADARMEYQVSLLSDALHQKFEQSQSREQQLQALQIAWLQAGPVEPALWAKLDARFARAAGSTEQAQA
jgi:hypothetical protein